jgi:hypothetical protein
MGRARTRFPRAHTLPYITLTFSYRWTTLTRCTSVVSDFCSFFTVSANRAGCINQLFDCCLRANFPAFILIALHRLYCRLLQSRTLILWMRQIPLLRELPLALGTYFATENGFTPQKMAKMDVGAYLERKISERVSEPVRVCSCI